MVEQDDAVPNTVPRTGGDRSARLVCAEAPLSTPLVNHRSGKTTVLLLHGIWNPAVWMWPMARRLRAAGFDPQLFGYRSVTSAPERTLSRLISRIRATRATALVGYSLGGLMALHALRRLPELPIRRVACVGSPLCGSSVAQGLVHRGAGLVMGGSTGLLLRGIDRWEGRAEVGQVAGVMSRGVGHYFADLGEASDGTVALSETRLPGLTDHCTVYASHSGLVISPRATAQVVSFLRDGRFQHD